MHRLTRSQRGLPADTRLAVGRFARWLRERASVRDDIIVQIANAGSLQAGESLAFGCFGWPKSRPVGRRFVWIFLAGRLPEQVIESGNCERSEAIESLLEVLAHEFAHYEQWRAGKRPSERGAQRRAKQLVRQFQGDH